MCEKVKISFYRFKIIYRDSSFKGRGAMSEKNNFISFDEWVQMLHVHIEKPYLKGDD